MRGSHSIVRFLSGSGLILGSQAKGWVFSLLLHATTMSMAAVAMNGLSVLPEQDPFRWDISLVEPSGPEPALEARARPAEPVPAPPVEASPAPQPVVERPVEPVREAVETMTATAYAAPEPAVEKIQETVRPAPMPAEAPTQPTQIAAIQPATSSVAEPTGAPAAIEPSAVQTGPARADYGWLAEMLYRRVSELKRYPASARLNGWEGRVVVRAVIQMDGHLTNLTVAESSGHETLDQAAMDAVRLACPLKLKHKLFGRSTVVVQVPISYTLTN